LTERGLRGLGVLLVARLGVNIGINDRI
jgi:hypothetical protein